MCDFKFMLDVLIMDKANASMNPAWYAERHFLLKDLDSF